jgi:hypothetical protein
MFKAVKRLAVSASVRSFMLRLAAINAAHDTGKLSDSDYEREKRRFMIDYQRFLHETPGDLIPDWAKRMG